MLFQVATSPVFLSVPLSVVQGNVGRLTPAVKASRAISTGPKMSGGSDFVPDMGRRNMMNALLTGSVFIPLLYQEPPPPFAQRKDA